MISYIRSNENGLVVLNELNPGCWINVVDPTPEEINQLQELGIPHDYITYPLDLDERPRAERENGEVLIVLRVPYFQGDTSDIPYSTIPLGIILNEQYILTICKLESRIVEEFFTGRIKNLNTAKRNLFVLRMLLYTATRYLASTRDHQCCRYLEAASSPRNKMYRALNRKDHLFTTGLNPTSS
jgi:magnesium transporter